MNNPFLKRLIKKDKSDILHSSAYAKAQNAGNIGVASTQSFRERISIDQNRKIVHKYRDSKLISESRRNSWREKQKAAQFGDIGNSGKSDSLRGNLNTAHNAGGDKDGNSVSARGPAQAPARKNPGISR